uniref:CCHC-type domain-containing protein n=1 Tax=Brassica oleracea var. oleracea TaxID=109376 RepID=A0A0D3EBM9_BRAOL
MEPTQHEVQDVLNISTEFHVFHRTRLDLDHVRLEKDHARLDSSFEVSQNDRDFSLLARLPHTARTGDRTDGLIDPFDQFMHFDQPNLTKARILHLSEDIGHTWSSMVFDLDMVVHTDSPTSVVLLTAVHASGYNESGQKPNSHLKQRNQRKRQNKFDDDEKWIRSGDCPFTKAKRSNRDVSDQNELQTYASLEKMLHKAIHVVRQLKKKGNTNTSSAPKQKNKAVKTTTKALSTRCFKCHRVSHYANKCQKQKSLLTLEKIETEPETEDPLPIFDDYAHEPKERCKRLSPPPFRRRCRPQFNNWANRLDTINTTLLNRLESQNQQPGNVPQQQLPPLHQQRQRQLPPQQQPLHQHQQQLQRQDQLGNVRDLDIHANEEEEEDDRHRQVYRDDLQHRRNFDNRLENGFKVDIPEFHGGLKGDDLIDWVVAVEEILDFKQVPPERRVSLVAMRFRGHAATWWKQLKTTRSRTVKAPIQTWEKLTKHLHQTFLPHNYERTIYNRLQNLRQGSLRQQLQTAMAHFDPTTVGEAHRRAATFEQQSRSSNWNNSSRPKQQDATSNTAPAKDATDEGKTPTPEEQTLRRSNRPNALCCYSCGEHGHRQMACPHATRRGLIAEDQQNDEEVYDSQEEDEDDKDLPFSDDGRHGSYAGATPVMHHSSST